jgi:hypothetical protein
MSGPLGIIGGIFRGRYVCGNLCPRGGFFDRLISPVSPKLPIPAGFRNMTREIARICATAS